jgi:hypothetical protein
MGELCDGLGPKGSAADEFNSGTHANSLRQR